MFIAKVSIDIFIERETNVSQMSVQSAKQNQDNNNTNEHQHRSILPLLYDIMTAFLLLLFLQLIISLTLAASSSSEGSSSSSRRSIFHDSPSFLSARRRNQRDPSTSNNVAIPSLSSSHTPIEESTNILLSIRGGDDEGRGSIQTITSLSQIQTIISDASTSNRLVVLDFTSNNCPPCEMIAPIYTDISTLDEFNDVDNKVIFCKVNVSDHPNVANYYNVDGWPTFILFRNGAVVDSIVGGQAAKAGLYGLIAKHNR